MLTVGQLVAGKYRIERELGRGGMGAVYVATNERLEKRVALKVLHDRLPASAQGATRLTREAISASRARHPGIVEIYDADTTDGVTWIAMELLFGESLAERMSRGRVPASEAVAIVREALEALAHVHRQGIIHRDLKPDNLFLEQLPDGRRRVKVLDFGIAASTTGELERLTRTGIAVGTPLYFAPEQAAGERDLDGRADVYAMGTILFELLAGRLPYDADSIGAMVRKMYIDGPPDLRHVVPHVSPALADVVWLALAVDRDARLPSAEAFQRALESVPLEPDVALAATQHAPMYAPAVATPSGVPVGRVLATGAPSELLGTAPTVHAQVSAEPARLTPGAADGGPTRRLVAMLVGAAGIALVLGAGVGVVGVVLATRAPPEVEPRAATGPVSTPEPDPDPDPDPPALAESVEPTPVAVPELAAAEPEPEPVARPSRPAARRPRPAAAPAAEPVAPRVAPPPATREPSASVAPPRPLEHSTWMQVLRTRESQLDACYFAHFTSPPRPRVETQATVHVSMSGSVESASVAAAPRPLARCLEGELRRLRFPAHGWASRGSFRLTLYDNP